VKPSFVLESVEQNILLDASKYQFDLPEKLRRKKAATASPSKSDVEKRQAVNLRRAKSRKTKKDAAAKAERNSPGLPRTHVPSPSPPPEYTRVPLNGGKYRYPKVEDEYVLRYAAVLYERDQQMSYAAFAAKLHAKVGFFLPPMNAN
jgi:hypothetical protein